MLNQPIDLDRVFHALSDPTRRGMIERLGRSPATVSELGQPVAISLAAVVQHVQILEASGLVRTEKVGRTRTCRINEGTLACAERWLEARRSEWSSHLDSPTVAPRGASDENHVLSKSPRPARHGAGGA
jgi:DNA-binding transcriptional ArsR family regulator